ncbi:MAG: cadherin repeat domain-containing protein, partial [Planctomycetes bacterium]|nr:cadherin repeat domain-containing protein [Planctomycetota bacterium]
MKRKIKPVFQLEQLEARLLLNAVPYIQDFSLGKPDAASGWDFYSDNEGRIEVVSGRLRMDDIAGNTTYSSNEAILHVDLTGKAGVTLALDHWNLSDENDALPDSFAGRFKGDGIALSIDGLNWVKVTDLTVNFMNQTYALDTLLQQAQIAASSTDVSDVRIKFQQYDNYSANTDGRELDNIIVNFTNQAPAISSVTASPPSISDTQTSQLQVTATDLDGPNALTYSWTVPSGQGSLDNLYIANPLYTPPDVSGTQTFTLTVKVSDGAA